jgi:hypothetical protein
MMRAIVLSVVMLLGCAAVADAATVGPVLAQYSSQTDDGTGRPSGNTRYRVRSTRGIGKLVGLGVVGVLAVGGWVARKIRGG